MSLDRSRIPKLSDSPRKFIPEKQRKAMNDPFVERITRKRTDNRKTVSSEERKTMLEVEVHSDQAMDENQERHGPVGRGNRKLASESAPVEPRFCQDFVTSAGTLDREGMSELSDISTDIVATRRLPTDNTMIVGVTEKQATSSSCSKRVKNTFGNIFPFTMGAGSGNEVEFQEEKEDDDEQLDFGSRVSIISSTQENEAYTDRRTGTMDQFGVVRTISKTTNTSGHSGDFVSMTNSEMRTGENRNTVLSNATADPEVYNEKTSRQRIKARISRVTIER